MSGLVDPAKGVGSQESDVAVIDLEWGNPSQTCNHSTSERIAHRLAE